jgi:hypothetical protein
VTFAPDFVEPVVGWRIWRIADEHGEIKLKSLFCEAEWPSLEPLEARCEAPRLFWQRRSARHEAPECDCDCGIHAAPWSEIASVLNSGLPRSRLALVVGEVSLWGRVVEAQRGWRAAFAYPRRLSLIALDGQSRRRVGRRARGGPLEEWRLARGLERYGVEVELVHGGSLLPAGVDS